MEHCRRMFEEVLGIHNEDCIREVEGSARIRSYKKKEIILREGEFQSEIPFIISGSFIGYYLDDGRRAADCIVDYYGAAVTGACDIESFAKPSDVYFEALERSEALCVPSEVIVHIVTTYPEALAAMQRIISDSLMEHRRMQRMNVTPLPQRYQMFCEMFPELSKRLNRTQTAMCLNASISALSRMLGDTGK